MKKFLQYLLILPLLWACNDNDDLNIVVNENAVKMNSTEEHMIETSTDKEVLFSSEDSYIATVDQRGVVKASKVGKTFIKITSGGKTQKVKITVEPKFWLYETPILDFGITMKTLEQRIGASETKSETVFVHKSSTSKNTGPYYYRFPSGLLKSVDLNVIASRADEVDGFLEERYQIQTENPRTYINGQNTSVATVYISSNKTQQGEVNVVYTSLR